jgi:glycosyltransferase involved in cell wall biosynthesis
VRNAVEHIAVCVCTYRRRELLIRLIKEVARQETEGLFSFSMVVADNDPEKSGRATVDEMQARTAFEIKYCWEPNRGIAWARNRVIANASGDYLAFIDDDEFPSPMWLRTLYKTCQEYGTDGVFGPVKRHFDVSPPRWMLKSKFYDRRVNPTGTSVEWQEARTGNVLLKRSVIGDDPAPFRPEFRVGEDQDFFRRKMEEGRRFVWCAEAEAFETVPPVRWKRSYLMKKALLRGSSAALQPSCGAKSILKSVAAVPLYAIALPFSLLAGQHKFMALLVSMCDHLGKLLALMGIQPIKEGYVSEDSGA